MRKIRSKYPFTLGFRVSSAQETIVENFADANRYTLGQAGREIFDARIKSLGLIKNGGGYVPISEAEDQRGWISTAKSVQIIYKC